MLYFPFIIVIISNMLEAIIIINVNQSIVYIVYFLLGNFRNFLKSQYEKYNINNVSEK